VVRRRYRKKIETLQTRIAEHEEKSRLEKQKQEPNEGLIAHWEQEIRTFEEAVHRTKKRLGR